MSASLKAHFAAVMGNSLTRNCREQGWSVEDALRDDDTMTAAMRTYAIDEDPLYSAMAEHVRWILMKIEQGIVADIRATGPPGEWQVIRGRGRQGSQRQNGHGGQEYPRGSRAAVPEGCLDKRSAKVREQVRLALDEWRSEHTIERVREHYAESDPARLGWKLGYTDIWAACPPL